MKKLKSLASVAVVFFIILCNASNAGTENDSLSRSKQSFVLGLRFQKAAGFYWSNGITAEYTNERIFKQKISLGFNFISSRLGTALHSNAIPFYETDIAGIKYFRQGRSFKPLARLNIGYAHADYGSDSFENLPDRSLLLSLEAGAVYDFKFPLRLALGGGYNFITGNGEKGMGVIFPFYAQFSILYRIIP